LLESIHASPDKTRTVSIEIFTDGACRGNPGPGGWGALLRAGKHEKELWGGEAHTTNNRMEMTAVIQALKALKKPSDAKELPNGLPAGSAKTGKQPLKSL